MSIRHLSMSPGAGRGYFCMVNRGGAVTATTNNTEWRDRTTFLHGREEVKAYLTLKWKSELDYTVRKELWGAKKNRNADVSEYPFSENSLMCFSLYQRFKIKSNGGFKGVLINFHPDFFCLHKHRNEVSCNGILFNNIYDSPTTNLQPAEMEFLAAIAHQLQSEAEHPALAQYEVLLSYLKIFLINASRIKMAQRQMEQLLAVIHNIVSGQLPADLQADLKSDYGGYWITELFELNAGGQSGYYIALENADTRLTLHATADGVWEVHGSAVKN